ncbi:hypothetical protein H5410_003860 [Solanum commersonii]|uniref:Uncharacterized protein n=1 Tax=Solanum commersonii TaxID=4109 RepID=A0A9J6B6V0_SOLCO|nr:hypothetical protein H5410_003860 [Solanum commersonii]
MKQKHVDSLQYELIDPPWVNKARERGNYRGRGRSSPRKSGSSYRSSSSCPIIQRGGMSLITTLESLKKRLLLQYIWKIFQKIIYYMHRYMRIYHRSKPWKIFQRYLVNELYFRGESYKIRSYYETILISTGSVEFQHFLGYNINENIIFVEDWGMFTMKERYCYYIHAFDKVLIHNNERHKHT